jgi:two-component system nitrate/nitrite response regulator NarL
MLARVLGRAVMPDIRVAVLDDQPLFRAGAVHTLSAEPDITVVGEGSSAADALHLAENACPDVMLLAVNMLGDDFEALQDVLARCPNVKLVVLSGDAEADHVRLAMRLGACGYVLDRITGDELAHSIRRIQRGERYVASALAVPLVTLVPAVAATPTEVHPDRLAGLTKREREVLAHVTRGLSNKEIGSKLKISDKTVKRHVSTALNKLGVSNRVQAAMLLHQR